MTTTNATLAMEQDSTYLTIVTDSKNDVNKRYSVLEGELSTRPSANIYEAKCSKVEVNTCKELKTILDKLDSNQALITGIYENDTQPIVSSRKLKQNPTLHKGALTRTKDHIIENNSYWQCIDIDDSIPNLDTANPKEVARFVREDIFNHPDMGIYVRASSSSRVKLNDKPIKAPSWHVWFKCDALSRDELKRFVKAWSWLNGLSLYKEVVAKNGVTSFIEKSPLDPSVFTHERLFFESAPTIQGEGLTLFAPDEFIEEGDCLAWLDIELINIDYSQAKKLKDEAKALIKPKREKANKKNQEIIKKTLSAMTPTGNTEGFNFNSSREEILLAFGYEQNGTAFRSPTSTTGQYGLNLLDDPDLISSHNASDPLYQYQEELGKDCLNKSEVLACLLFSGDIEKANQYLVTNSLEGVKVEPAANDYPLDNEEEEVRNSGSLYSILKGTKLGEYAGQVADAIQLPRDTAVLAALGIVSAPISMCYTVGFQFGGVVSSSIYAAGEQPPATGKTYLINTFTNPIQKAIGEMNTRAFKENEGNEEYKVPIYRAFLTDATPEALEGILTGNNGHFCLASSEQAMINTLLGMSYGGVEKKSNNDLILKAYGGEWHSSARISRRGYEGRVFGAVSVIAQSGTIDSILEQSNGTGIAERFLMLAEPHMLGYRDHLTKQARPCLDLVSSYDAAIKGIISTYEDRRASNSASTDYDNLPELKLSDRSWEVIAEKKQELEPLMANSGRFSHDLLRGAVGKFDQRVMKIAAVLHVIESHMTRGDLPAYEISHEFVELGVQVALLSYNQLYDAMSRKGLIGKTAEEETIYRVLTSKSGKGLLWRELCNSVRAVQPFNSYPSKGRVSAIKEVCERMAEKRMLLIQPEYKGGRKVNRITPI